ncbi:AAA family ATPase [Accumulibacter sp.]|uniref:AAA family ATPase n=1 Tax=Accumulibacter sp. TaxID=2053492 RepID=UPI0035ADB4FC
MLDFNDAPTGHRVDLAAQRDDLRAELLARLPSVLMALLPAGRVRGKLFVIGDVDGNPGDSLEIVLTGDKAGLWTDRATGEGGDVFELIARHDGLDTRTTFPAVMEAAAGLLGRALVHPALARTDASLDELGPHTAKWDYLSASGELIACVYRYDPEPGRKEFRPWDVRARMCRAPDPRPLYNLPAVVQTDAVVLVEGEKCADALIRQGIVGTTAMNGAKAPVDKTDWTPLAGKAVLIWPDRDAPGWDYAEAAARACVTAGCRSVAILVPPTDKPEKWDAADATDEGFGVAAFIAEGERRVIQAPLPVLPTFTLGALLDDDSPLPPDLIAPRVLTPSGMLVFGGAPKVGKSDFLLSWLTHMAAGATFLGLEPARPLRVFYLQAEVQYHYLRERVKAIRLPASRIPEARVNFVATPQLRLLLDDAGLAQIIPAIAEAFRPEAPDIIAIDPIRNVFDGGEGSAGENDNAAMLFFLSQRVERLRDAINPDAGIVLVHHTKKLGKRQFEEDPFQALSGASSLRGYYSTGMLLFRADETQSPRQVLFELRNGPAIPTKHVDKIQGVWREVTPGDRLVLQAYGAKLDAERRRKRDVILQILFEEAAQGRCYTANQLAESFESKAGLGGERTIRERISALATQGYIKFFRNSPEYGLPSVSRTKFGYLCVEAMILRLVGEPDPETGEVLVSDRAVLPTHYKCPQSGIALPVENPEKWVYQDDLNDMEQPA